MESEETTQQEKKTSEDSSTETNENENNPSQEGEKDTEKTEDESADESTEEPESNIPDENKVPFNKHPRFKELIAKNKQLIEENGKLKALEERQAKLEEMLKDNSPNIPEWFKTGFGDNEDMGKQFDKYNKEQKATMKQEILKELRQAEESKTKKSEEYSKIIDTAFEDLKASGATFDRNTLMKVISEYLPTNSDGSINMDKAYDIYKLKYPKKSTAFIKKEVAKKTSSDVEPSKVISKIAGTDWESIN